MPTITLRQAPDVLEAAGQRWHEAAVRGCLSAAMRGVQVIVTQIIPSRTPQPVDRSVYRAGWRAKGAKNGAVIENLEPTAILIEDGVRAENVKIGRLMIAALAEWVVRKGIGTEAEAEGIAWAIAKKMQRDGIFKGGLKILAELVDNQLPVLLEEEISREIAKVGLSD